MTVNTQSPKALSAEHAQDLADDLIRELALHVGDEKNLDATFLRWIDVLGVNNMLLVCMAGMRATFVDCLTVTEPRDWPARGTAFTTKATS